MKADWELKTLGEIYDVRDGTHDSPKYQDEGYPLITSKNLKTGRLNFERAKFISEEDYLSINRRSKVNKGDLLFAMIGTIGNPTLVEVTPNFAIKNVALLKPPENQSVHFLKYYLETKIVMDQMKTDAKGTTQKFVGLNYLRNFQLPLPPLEEQKRIVSILDEAFEGLDRARENAEANLKSARELFDATLRSVLSPPDDFKLRSGWEVKALIDVATLQRGFDLPKKERTPGQYPLVTSSGVTDTHNQAKVKGPGVVTGRSGSIGNVFYIDQDFWPLNTALYIKNFHKNNQRFIWYLLQLFDLNRFSSGTGVPTLNRNHVHSESVAVPSSLEEQRRIVSVLDEVLQKNTDLQTLYTSKLQDISDLRQSLLQKAFAGELT